MKNNLKMVIIVVAATLIIGLTTVMTFTKNTKEKYITLEFTKYDTSENKKEIYKTLSVKEKEVVEVDEENAITILEVNDNNIKISRDILKYRVISAEERKSESYKETITKTVEYGKTIAMDENEKDPFGPAYSAPRYSFYITVLKQKN